AVTVGVRGVFANQYDQAGIILRADEQTWLKTGLEFFEGRPRLSTVLTMGCSSWMVADLPPGTDEVTLRVSRRGDAVEVRYTAGDGPAELAALVFLPPDREMLAGVVCAAPEGSGFSAAFHALRVGGRDLGWPGAAGGAGGLGGPAAARADGPEEQAPDGASWAGDAPAGWAEARAEDKAADPVDWAKPLANEPAEDWDRLSLSVSTSWNAFAAAAPADEPPEEQEEEPARQPAAGGPAAEGGPRGPGSPGTQGTAGTKDSAG